MALREICCPFLGPIGAEKVRLLRLASTIHDPTTGISIVVQFAMSAFLNAINSSRRQCMRQTVSRNRYLKADRERKALTVGWRRLAWPVKASGIQTVGERSSRARDSAD